MNVPRLRTRLTLWFAASILLILSPFLAGLLVLEWHAARRALDHHLNEDLEVAAEMLAWRGANLFWRSGESIDKGYDAGPQRWVEVYGLEGKTLFLRGLPLSDVIRTSYQAPIETPSGFQTIRIAKGSYLRVLADRRRVEGRDVLIRVARTEDEVRANLRGLTLIAGLAAPLAVLAAAGAGYVISGRTLRPLAQMAERARSISADRLSERLPVGNTQDELGQLAVVFNETFARLEASFARMKEFTADVSHELRTPLTAIRSVGEVGLQEARTTAAYADIVVSMLEEADRLTRVVDTLLMLSRWESGRLSPVSEPIDLSEVARDVAAQLNVLAEERGVRIVVALGRPLHVLCDPVMARQAVINIVDNAIKFTREDGEVRLWSWSTAHEHGLVVDDQGPGIPAAERTRVIEPFYRIDKDRAGRGAGLGLALVHRAMAVNRGRLDVDANPAGGARIIMILARAVTSA